MNKAHLVLVFFALLFGCGTATLNNLFCSNRGDVPDYIVVGAGPAGSVFTRRACEKGNTVLLIERGVRGPTGPITEDSLPEFIGTYTTDNRVPYNSVPSAALVGYNRVFTEPQANIFNASTDIALGYTAGGGSNINGLLVTRGPLSLYDDYWPSNWNSAIMQNFFAKAENATQVPGANPSVRGTAGPFRTNNNVFTGYTQSQLMGPLLQQAAAQNYPTPADLNSEIEFEGVVHSEYIRQNGERVNVFEAYLGQGNSVCSHRGAFSLMENTTVDRVIFSGVSGLTGRPRARGVWATDGNTGSALRLCSNKGVVLAAGALNTPIILEKSGIGNKKRLRDLRLPVVVENNFVGEGLQDHLSQQVTFVRNDVSNNPYYNQTQFTQGRQDFLNDRSGIFTNPSVAGLAFLKVDESPVVNFEAQFSTNTGFLFPGEPPIPVLFVVCTTVHVESRGSVHLKNRDGDVSINPNYGSDERDLEVLAAGVQRIRQLVFGTGIVAVEIFFDGNINFNASLRATVEETKETLATIASLNIPFSTYHPAGSAALGTVVDPVSMEVHGKKWGRHTKVKGLHVVDASIFPRISAANTMLPTVAAAERAAQLIL